MMVTGNSKRILSCAQHVIILSVYCIFQNTFFHNHYISCGCSLPGKLDLIHADLSPSEQYKSMALAGLRPETIQDISSRAHSFWAYQCSQEIAYQEHMVKKIEEKRFKMEEYYENLINKITMEFNTLKLNNSNLRKEMDNIKVNSNELTGKYNETVEKLSEKSRQYQKLQMMYEQLRRNAIQRTDMANRTPLKNQINMNKKDFELPLITRDRAQDVWNSKVPVYGDDFRFLPIFTPLAGTHMENGPRADSSTNTNIRKNTGTN